MYCSAAPEHTLHGIQYITMWLYILFIYICGCGSLCKHPFTCFMQFSSTSLATPISIGTKNQPDGDTVCDYLFVWVCIGVCVCISHVIIKHNHAPFHNEVLLRLLFILAENPYFTSTGSVINVTMIYLRYA